MKAICASLILALLVTSTYTANACDDGATGTPFLIAAKAAAAALSPSVTTLTSGTTVTQYNAASPFAICNQVWMVGGTCCDVTGLNTLFAAKMGAIKTNWDAFIAGAVVVNTTLVKLQAMIANTTNATTDFTAANTASAAQFEGLSAAQAVNLSATINSFATAVADFKNTSAACFDALVNYRGAAMCFGCSAVDTDQGFFDATTGRLTIKQSVRDTIAMKCVKPWGFIYNLGGSMQMLAILNKQRSASATAAVRPTLIAYNGVTGPQLYEAFMACPNSTVTTTCTQPLIDRIILANLNLFSGEAYATANNLVATTASSQARKANKRILAAGSATGEITIAGTATAGADLSMTVTRPVYTGTVVVTSLPDAPVAAGSGSGSGSGSGTTTSAGNIFAMTAIATLAAFVLTLN